MADEITGAIDRRYETLRKRAEQESKAGSQQQQDMLKRQFAMTGGGPSGAYIKQSQLAEQAGQKNLQTAREGLDMQKNQEMQRRMETLEGRKYQTGERVASQDWQGKQTEAQRGWQSGERKAGEGFQTQMWQKNFDAVIKPKLDLAIKQFGLEESAQTANTKLQVAEAIKRGLDGYSYDDLKPYIGQEGVEGLYLRDGYVRGAYDDAFSGMYENNPTGSGYNFYDALKQNKVVGRGLPSRSRASNLTNPSKWRL